MKVCSLIKLSDHIPRMIIIN
uniref:Predicted protein n=1 Tax=Hordeum vulgare subsp. vulgare TaxID=112509 RepID=F2DIX1_HORVV|nr:predicted protein [Hordeum vulgare subsp. vulgare]